MSRLIAMFCDIDDFCKWFEPLYLQRLLQSGQYQRTRQTTLALSEIMTIIGHCQINPPPIQSRLPVAYSPHDKTTRDEPPQRHHGTMTASSETHPYKRHRFPPEIISHCVWLYFRFCLSYRDVEEMMLERGVMLSHEAVRYWCRKFGQSYANQLRRRRPRPGDKRHMDEAFLTINGVRHYLWRAVDQDDNVLDILVQSRRNKKAAKKFFKKLLKGLHYVPRVIITDKLKSYAAAKREVMPGVEHRQSRYLNNRCENSHRPTRQRERRMQRFKSPGHAQRFLSAYGLIASHFRPRRHLLAAPAYRQDMRQRFQTWREITGTAMAA